MGKGNVAAVGSKGPQFIYGQLSSNGYVATATFPLENFLGVPGFYTIQLRYRSNYDNKVRAIYFNLAVYVGSANVYPPNTLSTSQGPDFMPNGSTSAIGTPYALLTATVLGGNVVITYNSQYMAEGYWVKDAGEGCFVRAQQVMLQE